MARLSYPSRLIYVGLWTLCDDAGYFERRPAEICVALLPYEGKAKRLRLVERAFEELVALARVRWLECGEHGVVPTLKDHVIKGGNHSYTYRERHESVCRMTLFKTTSTHESVRVSDKSVSVSSSSSVGFDSSRAGARRLEEAATTAGGFVAHLASKAKA